MADNPLLVYSYPVSEYTTPNELLQERVSQMFGWDTTRPGREFLRRLFLSPEAAFGMGVRSPMGARIGNDHAWASQNPTGVMYPELGASLARRYPTAFRDRARAPFAEPPQLPPSNNNQPFLRSEDQAVNPYDFAAAWQQAMRQRLIPGGRKD